MHSMHTESGASTNEEVPPKKRRSSADSVLPVFLGAELKARWAAHCEAAGVAAGGPLRGFVEAQLAGGAARDAAASACPPGPAGADQKAVAPSASLAPRRPSRLAARPDEGRKVERSVYFTPSEAEALASASDAAKLGPNEYVIAAVRAALTRTPTFGQAELETLTASSELLAGLVVDLAKWRREIPETDLAVRLEALEAAVKAHVEASCKALAQGTRRWEIQV